MKILFVCLKLLNSELENGGLCRIRLLDIYARINNFTKFHKFNIIAHGHFE